MPVFSMPRSLVADVLPVFSAQRWLTEFVADVLPVVSAQRLHQKCWPNLMRILFSNNVEVVKFLDKQYHWSLVLRPS